jgi:hypothetical protein
MDNNRSKQPCERAGSDSKEDKLLDDDAEDLDVARDDSGFSMRDQESDEWLVISDSDDDNTCSRTSTWHASPDRAGHTIGKVLDPVIEDSDWDDALVLD